MVTAAVTDHIFWITSRAAGTAALILATVAVAAGLLVGGRMVQGRPSLRHLHEALSLATMVALVIHAVSLLGDAYLKPSVLDIAVPFASSYERWWMALGIVSGWAMLALGLSYYARRQIGQQRWRVLHRFTALAWIGGLVHALGMGTDAGQQWFLVPVGMITVPTLGLLASRLMAASTASHAGTGQAPSLS